MVLEFLVVFISWPFVALVLGLSFGFGFRAQIKQFLNNVASVRLPGGTEITTSQPPPPKSETVEDPAPPEPAEGVITLNEEQLAAIRSHIEGLAKEAANAVQEKDSIVETAIKLIEERDRDKKYWWFMYLSHFLVPNSKHVLRWFAFQPSPPTKEFYSEFWKPVIPESKERETIVMVLLHHGLIKSDGPVLNLSHDGRDFLLFIGAFAPGA